MSGNHRVQSDCDGCLALQVAFDLEDVETGSDVSVMVQGSDVLEADHFVSKTSAADLRSCL